VHLVNENYDEGGILGQIVVKVDEDDTPETLAAKVLVQEHKLYPLTLEKISKGEIKL
jgi:phosphoribosylglycinamide formyltransferase-1